MTNIATQVPPVPQLLSEAPYFFLSILEKKKKYPSTSWKGGVLSSIAAVDSTVFR